MSIEEIAIYIRLHWWVEYGDEAEGRPEDWDGDSGPEAFCYEGSIANEEVECLDFFLAQLARQRGYEPPTWFVAPPEQLSFEGFLPPRKTRLEDAWERLFTYLVIGGYKDYE
jgi:hypothetical protein